MNKHQALQDSIRAELAPLSAQLKGHLKGSPEYLQLIEITNNTIQQIFARVNREIGPIRNSGGIVVGVVLENDLSHTLVYRGR